MAFLKKKLPKAAPVETQVIAEGEPKAKAIAPEATCPCGAPIAKELGQNQVCKDHLRTN